MPIIRAVFLASVLIAGTIFAVREYEAIAASLGQINPLFLAPAALAAFAHVVVSYGGWRILLGVDGKQEWPVMRVFFIGQLGKYLPGGIWSFLAMAEYGRTEGISQKATWSASLLALLASLIGGGILALLVMPELLFSEFDTEPALIFALLLVSLAAVPIGLHFALPILRRLFKGLELPQKRAMLGSVVISMCVWLLGGLNLMLLAYGLGHDYAATGLVTFGAIYAAAWIAGFAFFVAPAGLGARESAMVALLSVHMTIADAVIIALLSRIFVTAADFVLGGIAVVLRPKETASATVQPRPHQG